MFLRVNTDLSTKGKEGYTDNDVFNRDIRDTQNTYMNYLLSLFEEEQRISDSLNPFIAEIDLPIVAESYGSYVTLPSDYRRRIEVGYFLQQSGASKIVAMDQLNGNEVLRNEDGEIRASGLSKKLFKYGFVAGKLQIKPDNLVGRVYLKYFQDFPVATRAVTDDTPNNQQNYDAGNTVDLIWDAQDEPNFIDLLLYYKGGIIKDNALMNWVTSKQQYLTPKKLGHV